MPYVQRSSGLISGLFANEQVGYAEEFLPGDNAEVVAFLNAPAPPIQQIRALERQYADDQARMTRVALLDLALEKAVALGYTHEQLMLADKGYRAMFLLEQQIESLRDLI